MGLPIRTLPLPTSQRPLPVGQLLVAGIVMPLAFAVVNQYLLNFQFDHPPDGPGTAILWLLFVSQICVVSAVGAHLVQKSWHGWAVYASCWLLVDLQVLWASSFTIGNGLQKEYLLLTALLAAQFGLVVVWSVLGEQKWTIRLPVLLGLAVVITFLLRKEVREYHHDLSYSLLFLIQILGLLTICLLLRCRGFSLRRPSDASFELQAPDWQFPVARFGPREFVVFAAVLALIFAALLYNEVFAGMHTANKPLNLAFASVLVALTMAVALWSALGTAPIEARIAGLLATCALSASGFVISDALFGDRYYQFNYSRTIWQFWSEAFASRGWIFAWMFLSGGLLFAALLLVRLLGYRLQRVAVAPAPVEDLKSVAADLPKGAYALLAKGRG